MKIAILQHNIVWGSPTENMARLSQFLDNCPETDLYVLPEMFATGFIMEPEAVAETDGGGSLVWMQQQARQRNAALAGSLCIKSGNHYYNRFYFVPPTGKVDYYDKRHLFTYGGEQRNYTAGKQRVVVEYKGIRFLLQVCYDLRFPVWSRNILNNGNEVLFDVVLYVASWPASRQFVWEQLLRARALENQCYVVGVNRIGNDPACQYQGGSVILDAYGRTLASCADGEEQWAIADIDIDKLKAFRSKFPVLADAEHFEIRELDN
jgi:predicted amidohydrolase